MQVAVAKERQYPRSCCIHTSEQHTPAARRCNGLCSVPLCMLRLRHRAAQMPRQAEGARHRHALQLLACRRIVVCKHSMWHGACGDGATSQHCTAWLCLVLPQAPPCAAYTAKNAALHTGERPVSAAGAAPHLGAYWAQQTLHPGGGCLQGCLAMLLGDPSGAAVCAASRPLPSLPPFAFTLATCAAPLQLPPLTARCTTTALPFSSARAEGRMEAPWMAAVVICWSGWVQRELGCRRQCTVSHLCAAPSSKRADAEAHAAGPQHGLPNSSSLQNEATNLHLWEGTPHQISVHNRQNHAGSSHQRLNAVAAANLKAEQRRQASQPCGSGIAALAAALGAARSVGGPRSTRRCAAAAACGGELCAIGIQRSLHCRLCLVCIQLLNRHCEGRMPAKDAPLASDVAGT